MKLISNELTDVYIPTSNVLHLVQTILMTSDRRYWKILSICSHAPFTSRFLSSPSPLSADHHKVDLARDHQSAGNRTPPDRLSDSCSYVHNKDACTLNPKAACILTTLTSSLQTPVNHFQDGGFWRIVTAVGLFAVYCNSNQQKALRFSFFYFQRTCSHMNWGRGWQSTISSVGATETSADLPVWMNIAHSRRQKGRWKYSSGLLSAAVFGHWGLFYSTPECSFYLTIDRPVYRYGKSARKSADLPANVVRLYVSAMWGGLNVPPCAANCS